MAFQLKSSLLAASAFVGFSGAAYAQEAARTTDSEAIIVTADQFERPLQRTPMAVSVVSGEEISNNGRTRIDDVLVNQPATVVQGAARGFLVSIRGLGLSLPPQMGQGAVSTNYDGAFSSRAEPASAGFYDIERVEVLRGPQATLYGRNSVGGVVNIISRQPTTEDIEGYVTAEIGDYSLRHVEGAVNMPFGDSAALRIAGSAIDREGYMSNGHDDNVAQAVRARLLLEPSDAVSLVLSGEHTHVGGEGPGAVPIAPGQQMPNGDRITTDVAFGAQDIDASKFWLTLNADIGPGRLFFQPSRQETEGTVLGAFGGNFANNEDPKINRQDAVEIRYSSRPGAELEWNVGYYYYDGHNEQQTISGACQDTAGFYVVPPPGFNAQPPGPPGPAPAGGCLTVFDPVNYLPDVRDSTTSAVFGQMIFPLAENTRLILGGRQSSEKIDGENNNNVAIDLPRIEDEHFDYRVGLETYFSETSMLYATIASGYRQGGYNFDNTPFAPEEMVSYEIGSRNRFGDVLFNASAFYYDYDSFQLVLANFSTFPPQINVKTMGATEYGVELEAQAPVGDNGRLNGSLVWVSSELDGRDGLFIGSPFPNSPELSVKVGYSFDIDIGFGTLTPRFDLRYVGEQYVFPDEATPTNSANVQPAYTTGDISLLFQPRDSDWSINAYVKNANDELIKQSHFFGYAQLAAPRTVGLVVSRRF